MTDTQLSTREQPDLILIVVGTFITLDVKIDW